MRHFPAFLDLRGRRALVLGAGEIAERKAEPLARAGAILVRATAFDPVLLDGCAIAVGADAPEADLAALSAEAMRRGIPVNIVDRPALCSFIMPALIDRDPVTIAVSTGGAAPVLARLLRARIEVVVPPAFGRLAALAEGFAAEVRSRLPDLGHRRRMLERVFAGRVADLVFAGQEAAAGAAFRAALDAAEAAPEPGIVYLLDTGPIESGRIEPDLLTLRALRVLGEADLVAHDDCITIAVLDVARRDAARLRIAGDMTAYLAERALAGCRIVRLGRIDPAERHSLIKAGVRVQTVPAIAGVQVLP